MLFHSILQDPDKKVNVICVDFSGKTETSVIYAAKKEIAYRVIEDTVLLNGFVIPEAEAVEGYNFKGWSINSTIYNTSEDAENAVRELALTEPDITVALTYEKAAEPSTSKNYTDEQLVQWSAKDYQDKTGKAVTAEIKDRTDDRYEIELKDSDGKVLDKYTIDPESGSGSDTSGNAVDLPQTGMSGAHKVFAGLAVLMAVAGIGIVKRTRKEYDEE